MTPDNLGTIVAIALLLLMAFAVWRGGQSNPVGTGVLQRKVNAIASDLKEIAEDAKKGREANHKARNIEMSMKGLEGMIKAAPTNERIDEFEREVEGRLSKVEENLRHVATKADVEGLSRDIEHVCRQNDKTDAAVVRIEQFLLSSKS